jgi:hypothetical protein
MRGIGNSQWWFVEFFSLFGILRETILSHTMAYSIVWSLYSDFVICTLMAIVINLTASLNVHHSTRLEAFSFNNRLQWVESECQSIYHKLYISCNFSFFICKFATDILHKLSLHIFSRKIVNYFMSWGRVWHGQIYYYVIKNWTKEIIFLRIL